MVLEKLLRDLVSILLQSSAAEKCIVVLRDKKEDSNNFVVQATGTDEKIETMQEIQLKDYGAHACLSLIFSVTRLKQTTVLGDATKEGNWTSDEYVVKNQSKSILCMPIIQKEVLLGVLYLENNTLVNAFTTGQRMEILKVLSSQISISIQNAFYLENLQKINKELELRDAIKSQLTDSNLLLERMLPRTSLPLLKKGQTVSEQFPEVSILFSYIADFSDISMKLKPLQLLKMLNDIFSNFDNLVDQHHLYKVETVGDAYFVIGGAHTSIEGQFLSIGNLALDMQQAINNYKPPENISIKVKIGINTGPVYGGVVGLKMPRYCFFGDTVNTASRMASTSIPSKIQLSASTFNKMKDLPFKIQERGEVDVKGKGKMRTYFLEGRKEQ
jgi:class 3 adenylate cyclase